MKINTDQEFFDCLEAISRYAELKFKTVDKCKETHLPIKECSCGKNIVFLTTKNGKMCPVLADTVDSDDFIFNSKKHANHFLDCPDKDDY